MRRFLTCILATVSLGAAQIASAQTGLRLPQTLLDQQNSQQAEPGPPAASGSASYKSEADKLKAEQTAEREWLMNHPEKTGKDIDMNDPELQILVSKDETLSPAELEQKEQEVWREFSKMRQNEEEDASVGQEGKIQPPNPPLPIDQPPPPSPPPSFVSAWGQAMAYHAHSQSSSFPNSASNPNGQNNNTGGGNGVNNGGSGGTASLGQAYQFLLQMAQTFYQDYQAEKQTTISTLLNTAATADAGTAALCRIVAAGLQAGKSAAQIANDLYNYYSQHLDQFQGGAGVVQNRGLNNNPQSVQPKPTQPTSVAMPGYGQSSSGQSSSSYGNNGLTGVDGPGDPKWTSGNYGSPPTRSP